jgi:hypothetical protein
VFGDWFCKKLYVLLTKNILDPNIFGIWKDRIEVLQELLWDGECWWSVWLEFHLSTHFREKQLFFGKVFKEKILFLFFLLRDIVWLEEFTIWKLSKFVMLKIQQVGQHTGVFLFFLLTWLEDVSFLWQLDSGLLILSFSQLIFRHRKFHFFFFIFPEFFEKLFNQKLFDEKEKKNVHECSFCTLFGKCTSRLDGSMAWCTW